MTYTKEFTREMHLAQVRAERINRIPEHSHLYAINVGHCPVHGCEFHRCEVSQHFTQPNCPPVAIGITGSEQHITQHVPTYKLRQR